MDVDNTPEPRSFFNRTIGRFFSLLELSRPYRTKFGFLHGMIMGLKARQLIWALPKNTIVMMTVPGIQFPISLRAKTTDLGTFNQVFLDEEHAIDVDVAPASICDLGANVGLASIHFANRFPRAKILAVEPDNRNFDLLRINTAHYENIHVIQAAVWTRDTTLAIIDSGQGANAFQATDRLDGQGVLCKGISIANIVKNHFANRIDLLKLDIEGSELDLFSDATSLEHWIDKIGILMVELHERDRVGCRAGFEKAVKRACKTTRRGEFDIAYFSHAPETERRER